MPTVKIIGRFQFHFYSADRTEPPHIHVRAPDGDAKFWLQPIALEYTYGFSAKDVSRLTRLVYEHQELFLEAWHEYFE